MTVTASRGDPDIDPRPRFGVFPLVGESFALLRDAFLPLVGTAIVIVGARISLFYGIQRAVAGSGVDVTIQRLAMRGTLPSPASAAATAAFTILAVLAYALTHVALLSIALRRGAGEPVRAGEVARTALRYALPMSGAYVSIWFLIVLGLVALIVPGIWLAGVYAVAGAVIVVEDRPRGFLRRARELSKDYRWPLVGYLVLVYLVAIALGGGAYGLGRLVPALVNPTSPAQIAAALLVGSLTNGIAAAVSAATVALAYRRLRAIKDGGGDLRAVFE